MLLELIGLLAGLALLVKGADWLVVSARDMAFDAGIPASVIGLTIVAMGSSIPELVVGISSSLRDVGEIAIGDVIGSNIANLCLITGLAALIRPVPVSRSAARMDMPVACGATLLFLMLSISGRIGRAEGLFLLGSGFLFLLFVYRRTVRGRNQVTPSEASLVKKLALLCTGLICVLAGGHVTLHNAVSLAGQFHISPFLVALVVIALGTALPELVTSITAARKGAGDLVLGSCLGSVIVNTLFVLGAAAVIRPLQVPDIADVAALFGVSGLLLLILLTRDRLGFSEGLLLVSIYGIFIGYRVIAGAA